MKARTGGRAASKSRATRAPLRLVPQYWSESLYMTGGPPKTLLVLHHTSGYDALGALRWNQISSSKSVREGGAPVGAHDYVSYDGLVYQAIPYHAWAYHLGVGPALGADRRSVAVEIDNLGGMIRRQDGKLYDIYGQVVDVAANVPYNNERIWRQFQFFEEFYQAQVDALIGLTRKILSENPGIPPRIAADFFPESPLPFHKLQSFEGILAHTHFRSGGTSAQPAAGKHDVAISFKPWFDYYCTAAGLEQVRL